MYCGTSNIVLPVKNKTFYPPEFRDGPRLTYYASLFNTLEVNQTFYKLPQRGTVTKWSEETPDGFRFSMKLGKQITHCKGLQFDTALVARYLEVFNAVGPKKGCLLVQLPAGTKVTVFEQLQLLLEIISELNEGWKIAVEFRDPSWYSSKVYALIKFHGALLVEHDMPASHTPISLPASDTRYFRFHGAEGDYKGSYGAEVLRSYALRMQRAAISGQEVYAYFNNTIGDAYQNALTLIKEYERM